MSGADGDRDGPGPAANTGLALLEKRRSVGAALLREPGPDAAQLRRMLAYACRAPDHGALEPWRFIIVEGEARHIASVRLAACYASENQAMEPEKLAKFTGVMARIFCAAPVVAIVVSRPDRSAAIPLFEQELSAGAVCMNLLTAAHVSGFDANWVTGFAATNKAAGAVLGIGAGEKIAGVIHIGTALKQPAARRRPDLDAITTWWPGGLDPQGV